MNTKVIIGGVIGAIVMFLLGWLIYGVLLTEMFPMDGEPESSSLTMVWIFLGNLFFGILLAYIMGVWANNSTAIGGAKTAAIVGLLAGLSTDSMMMAFGELGTTQMIVDVLIGVAMAAAAGAAIGWYYGRGAASE